MSMFVSSVGSCRNQVGIEVVKLISVVASEKIEGLPQLIFSMADTSIARSASRESCGVRSVVVEQLCVLV